jgi:hypothetical protein
MNLNRRKVIGLGGLAFGSFALPHLLRAQATNPHATAKNIIHIYLPGGISHQESFDPKPYAPSEYRGPLGTVQTNVDGILLGEHFQNTAKITDKIAIIRSMTHGEAAHERGTHNMFTGYRPSPALKYPSIGSIISHELGGQNNLPAYVSVPNQANEFAGTGYLSNKYGPFSVGSDPADAAFKVQDLNSPVELSRFDRRKNLLETINTPFESSIEDDGVASMEEFYNQAYGLIGSQSAKDAFDLSKEDAKIKELYGNTQAGQRFLLSRRLIEGGVRMVSVTYGGWDHHDNIKAGYETQAPILDKAFAALISDLESRGLLETTLVVISSEFGRTPKINNTNGRDHWPRVFSTVMAGGGIKGGQIYGSSDALGAEVDENPVSPADLAMTMYHTMGINGSKELIAPGPRPIEIVDGGKILTSLL